MDGFPAVTYAARGGVGAVKAAAHVAGAREAMREPDPARPGTVIAVSPPATAKEPPLICRTA